MAATCPPLDPSETRQMSGPHNSPCTRLFLDFAKKHCWRCLSSVESSAFRSFQISQFTNRRRDLRALVGMSVGFPSRIHHSSTECVGLQ